MKLNLFTLFSLIVTATGAIAPYLDLLPKSWQLPIVITGAVATACSEKLVTINDSAQSNQISKALVFLCAPVLLLALFSSGCGHSELKKTATALNDASIVTSQGIDLKRELAQEGVIDGADELAITRDMIDLNNAETEFNDQALCYHSSDPNAARNLAQSFRKVTTALQHLLDDGALHIKNANAKKRFNKALIVANASADVVQIFLNHSSAPSPSVELPADVAAICQSTSQKLKENADRLNADLARLGGVEAPAPPEIQ